MPDRGNHPQQGSFFFGMTIMTNFGGKPWIANALRRTRVLLLLSVFWGPSDSAQAALVSHFNFESETLGVVSDQVTVGNSVTMTNGAALGASKSGFGTGLVLDGVDDDAKSTAAPTGLPAGSAARTLSVWARLADANAGLIGGYGANGAVGLFSGLGPRTNNAGTLSFHGWGTADFNSSTALTLNTWDNYLFTYAGGTLGALDIYRNGVLLNSITRTLATTLTEIGFGRHDTVGARWLNGTVDDFAVWDTALTVGKVKAITALGNQTGLTYTADDANALFNAFDGATSVVVDGLTWNYVTGLTGAAGDLSGSGTNFTLQLDGSTGLSTIAIPEPGTWAMLCLAGFGLFARVARRTAKKKSLTV
jgi:hypothetical protein